MTAVSPQVIAAAIDIGSNSIKMTIGRADGEGGIEQLDWASEVVRLGQGLDRTGVLDEERIEFASETLKLFTAQARERGAERIVAVATEATRAAGNGASFLDRVRKEFFRKDPPTSTGVGVTELDLGAALEVNAIAAVTD